MATPQSSASQEDAAGAKKLEQITFRFCSECSNMLYPKEDEDAHKLQFVCRTCQYTEDASSTCVFRNVLNNSAGETAGVTQDVASDPTVSQVLPVFCLTCGTIILCDFCPDPAAFLSVVRREDRREGSVGLGMAHFILGLVDGDDPLAEYDEEPQDGGWSDDAPTVVSDESLLDPATDTNAGSPGVQLRARLGVADDRGHELRPHINGEARHQQATRGSDAMVVHL